MSEKDIIIHLHNSKLQNLKLIVFNGSKIFVNVIK